MEGAYPSRLCNESSDQSERVPYNPETEISWLDYTNSFELIEDVNSLQVTFLEEPPDGYYWSDDTDASTTNRRATGMFIDGKVENPSSSRVNPPVVIDRGFSGFQVRIHGYAIRVGHKIAMPSMVSVDGDINRATRAGQPRVIQRQIGKGDVPVYLAMWDILYNITNDPHSPDILAGIKSSGGSAHYT